MLAGRKLLLADDSITIQKVVDLTFADEGVKVFCFGNGREAIERLDEIAPDIVLADVFMPQMGGLEVCRYIKQSQTLKHIPVMLLVGSFEPFDEAEARRAGADDILTKPFQSIRRLIDKVGGLISGEQSEESPTAELPRTIEATPAPELSTKEIEMTTADTQRLPAGMLVDEQPKEVEPEASQETADDAHMEPSQTQLEHFTAIETSDELLDLGDIGAIDQLGSEESVLDLDFDQPAVSPVQVATAHGQFLEPQVSEAPDRTWQPATSSLGTDTLEMEPEAEGVETFSDQMASTQEFPRPTDSNPTHFERITDDDQPEPVAPISATAETAAPGRISLDQLDPEVINAIARRAVELLSDKAIREIAWEVVPELSELMIRRQLEEKKS